MTKVCIEALIDHDKLVEENSYDVAAVRINARDEFGNILPFFNDPISLSIEGPCEIIGPKVLALQGGMGGTYIKTTGKKGAGKLTISCGQAEDVEIKYNVEM
jgi:beta-galactosidase